MGRSLTGQRWQGAWYFSKEWWSKHSQVCSRVWWWPIACSSQKNGEDTHTRNLAWSLYIAWERVCAVNSENYIRQRCLQNTMWIRQWRDSDTCRQHSITDRATTTPFVTVHVRRYRKSAKYIFQITTDFAFIGPSTSSLKIWALHHCRVFHPEQRKLRSLKQQFLYASNFSMYTSVTRRVYSDHAPMAS
jgi:hypothetical protein